MIVYINDKKLDLEASKPIAVTKQVNDIGNLSNRQNDFSQKIKAPFTSHNKQILSGLATLGSASQIPYQNNTAKIFDNNGNAVIANGFAVVKETTNEYEIVIFQGVLSLFKKVANTTLKDIGLSDLNHLKNVPTILNTWTNDLDYVYLIADYNGKFFGTLSNLNADYLVPSAYVKYIWQRIFEYAGFTFGGSIFDTDRFKNLCITYPKPVGSDEQNLTNIYNHVFTTQTVDPFRPNPVPPPFYIPFYFPYLTQTTVSNAFLQSQGDGEVLEVLQDGFYKIKITGTLGFPIDENSNYSLRLNINDILIEGIDRFTFIDLTIDRVLNAGDIIFLTFAGNNFASPILTGGNLTINIFNIEGDEVDFEEAFIDFKTTDFLKEIMHQFGLTPFISETQNHVEFLTEDERLKDASVIDISDKFIEKTKEVYQIGYAQRNFFKYKYNAEGATHYNGFIAIGNPNLSDEKTIIASQTYAPDREQRRYANKLLDICRMWDKEVNDDAEVEYKELDKRFYFLEVEPFGATINLQSETFNQLEEGVTNAKWGRFLNNRFRVVISNFYNATRTILNNTNLTTASMWLNALDLQLLDLKNQYHIKQLGGNFIINKIINFVPNVPTRVELLKVNTKELFIDGEGTIPPDLFIVLSNPVINDCILTLDVNSNITQPYNAVLTAFSVITDPLTGLPTFTQQFEVTIINNSVSIPLETLPNGFYNFGLVYLFSTASNIIDAIEVNCFDQPDPETLIITSIQTLSIVGNDRNVRINFTTSIELPDTFEVFGNTLAIQSVSFSTMVTPSQGNFVITLPHTAPPPIPIVNSWRLQMKKGTTTSNPIDSNG